MADELKHPHMVMLAGPNGAAKTTAASVLLTGPLAIREFVNADTIARGLSAFNPEGVAVAAGRIMLQRLDELADRRADFAFETTLSGRTYFPWVTRRRAEGYRFHLLYFWLSSADLAIERVRERARRGGHHIPDDTVRRRYRPSVANLLNLYRAAADDWRVYDNSDPSGMRLVAAGSLGSECVTDPDTWVAIRGGMGDGE